MTENENENVALSAKEAAKIAEEAALAAQEAAEKAKQLEEDERIALQKTVQEKSQKEALGKKKPLPEYFTIDKFKNHKHEKKLYDGAMNFLKGIEIKTDKDGDTKTKFVNSYSAKITHIGKRRVLSKRVLLGIEDHSPKNNNWKVFQGSANFFRGIEYGGLIKDPQFIRIALLNANYAVRWVKDSRKNQRQLKKEVFVKSEKQLLQTPLRLRIDRLKMGLQIPVTPQEAVNILADFKKTNTGIKKEIKKYLENKAKEKEKE